MTTIHNTTITEPVYLPSDCWSEVLSFINTRKRILVEPVSKEIQTSLQNSFADQVIDLRNTRVTDAGLARFAKMKEINLGYCRAGRLERHNYPVNSISDAGLAHLKNVEVINLKGCTWLTDAGLAHLEKVKVINLFGCVEVTDAGLAHLKNVEKIYLGRCDGVTNAERQRLKTIGVEVIG